MARKYDGLSIRGKVKARFLGGLLALSIVATGGVYYSSQLHNANAIGGGLTFSKIATHPRASKLLNTPYSGGAIIHSLYYKDGKLYSGYGDWNGNSDSRGPVEGRTAIIPYDVVEKTWDSAGELIIGGEAIDSIREFNGDIYIPNLDPSIYGLGGYATNATGGWSLNNAVPEAVHVFDIASPGLNELWLFGATHNPAGGGGGAATAWRSTDNGANWSVVKQESSKPSNSTGGLERYYWGAALNGKVFMHAADISPRTPMHRFDTVTGTWSDVPSSNGQCRTHVGGSVVFGDKVVCAGGYRADGSAGPVAFDDNGVFSAVDIPSTQAVSDST